MLLSRRLQAFKSNVFSLMDQAKHQARQQGHQIIDLSIGSSDLSPPPEVIQTIRASLDQPETYGYTLFHKTQPFREACAAWYQRKFGLSIDPDSEVLPLIGSQEGTALIALATLNPGDGALLTDPCYPSHFDGVGLAEGQILSMPLSPDHHFLPDLTAIAPAHREQARLMILCYPHNPTAAMATPQFWQEAVNFCQAHDIVLAHDFPYADWVYEGGPAPSVLQSDPTKSRSIEFFSLSKSFHMGGFRVGYAIGNAEIVKALAKLRSTLNFNQYLGILQGATVALNQSDTFIQHSLEIYRSRRDCVIAALQQMGWSIQPPPASMYVWLPLPAHYPGTCVQFCLDLVQATGVALAPGTGFGPGGEGYVRLALVVEGSLLADAIQKMAKFCL